jgi:hypothetical protein
MHMLTFLYLKHWPWPTTSTPARLSGSIHMYTVNIPLSQTVAVANYIYTSQIVRYSIHMYTVNILLSQTLAVANYIYTGQIVK